MTTEELSPEQRKIIAFIEQAYYETGSQPTNERIKSALGLSDLKYRRATSSDAYRNALYRKGLHSNDSEDILTVEQLQLINIVCNTWDKRSPREKLKNTGITYSQYRAWMQQPAFKKQLQARVDALYGDLTPVAKQKFVEAVEAGYYPAVERHLEATGTLPSKSMGDFDVAGFLAALLEILTKYVAVEVMERIADELEIAAPGILGSKKRPAIEAIATPVETLVRPEPQTEESELGNIFSF